MVPESFNSLSINHRQHLSMVPKFSWPGISLMCLTSCILDNLIKGDPKGKVLVEENFNSQDNKTPKEPNFKINLVLMCGPQIFFFPRAPYGLKNLLISRMSLLNTTFNNQILLSIIHHFTNHSVYFIFNVVC